MQKPDLPLTSISSPWPAI